MNSATAAIEITNLKKAFGKQIAVDDLSLSIPQGEIFGFVGPNGAGKTSTIRMIVGLLQPDFGGIHVLGHDLSSQFRRLIGYMPDFFGTYPDLKVWEYLDFFGACYRIDEQKRPKLIEEFLELVDLAHRKDDLVDQLSTGLKQRLSLARALIHNPQVLVLDEPAAGLDPRARVEIRALLLELQRMGKTIFFSTHILSDVAEICTSVGVIEAGKLVAAGNLEDLQIQYLAYRKIRLTVLGHPQTTQNYLTSLPHVSGIEILTPSPTDERSSLCFEFQGNDHDLSEMLRSLIHQGIAVLHFSEENGDLEDLFMKVTKGLVT
jgi:ABC-2 type transport system ATP-binding protein